MNLHVQLQQPDPSFIESAAKLGTRIDTTKGVVTLSCLAFKSLGTLGAAFGSSCAFVAPLTSYLMTTLTGYVFVEAFQDLVGTLKRSLDLWRACKGSKEMNLAKLEQELQSKQAQRKSAGAPEDLDLEGGKSHELDVKIAALKQQKETLTTEIHSQDYVRQKREAQITALKALGVQLAFFATNALALVALASVQLGTSWAPLEGTFELLSLLSLTLGSACLYWHDRSEAAKKKAEEPVASSSTAQGHKAESNSSSIMRSLSQGLVEHRFAVLTAFAAFAAVSMIASLGALATASAAVAPVLLTCWRTSVVVKSVTEAPSSPQGKPVAVNPTGSSFTYTVQATEEEKDKLAAAVDVLDTIAGGAKPVGGTLFTISSILREFGWDDMSAVGATLASNIQTPPAEVWRETWEFLNALIKGHFVKIMGSCFKALTASASFFNALAKATVFLVSREVTKVVNHVKTVSDFGSSLIIFGSSHFHLLSRLWTQQPAPAKLPTLMNGVELDAEISSIHAEMKNYEWWTNVALLAGNFSRVLLKGALLTALYTNPLAVRLAAIAGGLGMTIFLTTVAIRQKVQPYKEMKGGLANEKGQNVPVDRQGQVQVA